MMLEVSDLCTGYGRIPILNGVSFAVEEGEFVGVLGHNGMGKTTLLRALMGYIPATAGRVVLEDADITRAEPYRRARRRAGWSRRHAASGKRRHRRPSCAGTFIRPAAAARS